MGYFEIKLLEFVKETRGWNEDKFSEYMKQGYHVPSAEGSPNYILQQQLKGFFYKIIMENVNSLFNHGRWEKLHLTTGKDDKRILYKVSALLPTLYGNNNRVTDISYFEVNPENGIFRDWQESCAILLNQILVKRSYLYRNEKGTEEYKAYQSAEQDIKTLKELVSTLQFWDDVKEKLTEDRLTEFKKNRNIYHAQETRNLNN